MDNQRIGFIGLGAMGEPMVANLLNAGFQVCSYVNRSREAMDRLKQSGLEEVANAQEVAKRSDIIMCCVFDERQNDAVLRGNTGVIGSLASGFYRIADEHHLTGLLSGPCLRGSQKRYHRSRLPAIGDGSRRYRRHLISDDGRISEGYRPLPGNTRSSRHNHALRRHRYRSSDEAC